MGVVSRYTSDMGLEKVRIVLVCHYAASLPDLFPLYELLSAKGIYVRFLFADGWLLGPETIEGTHHVEDIKKEIQKYSSKTIEEIDISEVRQLKKQSEHQDLIFFLATNYLNSLPQELINLLIDSSIYYTPYGYPVFEIGENLSIIPTNDKKFEYVLVQDKLELDVWAGANPESKLAISPKPFTYKKTSLVNSVRQFQINRVCIHLHHQAIPGQMTTANGFLIYQLDKLVQIIERNTNSHFVIRAHPILLSKLQMLAGETIVGLELLTSWNIFVEQIIRLPNSEFSDELDWEIDYALAGIVFTESPSLAIKSRYRFRFSLPVSLNFDDSISRFKVNEIHGVPTITTLSQMEELVQNRRKFLFTSVLGKYLSFVHVFFYQRTSKNKAWKILKRILLARA